MLYKKYENSRPPGVSDKIFEKKIIFETYFLTLRPTGATDYNHFNKFAVHQRNISV